MTDTLPFSENVKPNLSDLPVKIGKGSKLSGYTDGQKLSRLHFHDEIEVLTVLSGSMDIEFVDESRCRIYSGQTVFLNSRVLHSTYYCDGLSYDLIQFRAGIFGISDSEISELSPYIRKFARFHGAQYQILNDREIYDTVVSISNEFSEKKIGYDMFVISGLYRLIGFFKRVGVICDDPEIMNIAKLKRLLPVISYVDENYQKEIPVVKMGELIGVSEFHFCRICKEALGGSFVDYLNFVRVSHAEQLLRTTDISVLDVALSNGFSSISYFNRVFRKFKGCSPLAYRKASKRI